MISIQEYATSRGISRVAVSTQIKRYEKELEGHIIQDKRRRLLDDDAVAFLDQHRMPREIIVEQSNEMSRKEIDQLRAELDIARNKITELQDTIIALKDLQIEHVRLEEQNRFLLEQKDEKNQETQKITEELSQVKAELSEVKDELGSFNKTWFGFYRKK